MIHKRKKYIYRKYSPYIAVRMQYVGTTLSCFPASTCVSAPEKLPHCLLVSGLWPSLMSLCTTGIKWRNAAHSVDMLLLTVLPWEENHSLWWMLPGLYTNVKLVPSLHCHCHLSQFAFLPFSLHLCTTLTHTHTGSGVEVCHCGIVWHSVIDGSCKWLWNHVLFT